MKQWKTIVQHIEDATGEMFSLIRQQGLSGGSINKTFVLMGKTDKYFVKTNNSGHKSMFEAEAKGLQAMASSQTLKVPMPLCYGEDDVQSYIVMEYLAITGRANQVELGEQLAAMHGIHVKQFGWERDNT
ncbi:MAG: fructosamine kinase family protein, partial [Gammaproteobacteria bacterium]|nr:fructosamine kinase family protein [Gammaproteobacteria bacterium]